MGSPMTFGRVVRHLRVGDSLLEETIHSAGLFLPRHQHPNPSLTMTVDGFFTEMFGRRSIPCDVSTIVLKPAGESHSNRYGPSDVRCLMVGFGPAAAAHIRSFSSALDRVGTVHGGPPAAAMHELGRELRLADPASPLIVEGCIWRVLGQVERCSRPGAVAGHPAWLARVEEFIRENAHRRLSLAELAAVADVHPAHLNKTFKRHFGSTVGAYLRRLQIERASHLLTRTRIPLAQLATELGFCDQSHFARAFKSVTGATPSEFRGAAGAFRPKLRFSS
ncbi:MAG: AraC family transcriptional regulator [Acidobacteria bacterium]|nr:AraC family transcriptional regulator [Acidobacteriota bacterium]